MIRRCYKRTAMFVGFHSSFEQVLILLHLIWLVLEHPINNHHNIEYRPFAFNIFKLLGFTFPVEPSITQNMSQIILHIHQYFIKI